MDKDYKIVDVSQWIDDFVFPENPSVDIKGPFNRVSGSNPEFVYDFTVCTQSGTHIQGPHYFLEDGKRIDEFPLSTFEGTAAILDLEKRGVDTTAADLEQLLTPSHLTSEILIFRTGNMEEIIAAQKIDASTRPGLSLCAANFLANECGYKMLAIDSIGFESRVTENFEVNLYLCKQGLVLLEGLVNLEAVTKQNVFLEAFPLKLRGVEGSPCRAIVKEEL